jgi:hypothetical protein
MSDTNQHEVVESLFERIPRRDEEINHALKLEAERHEAIIKNMHRLKALRLARDAKSKTNSQRALQMPIEKRQEHGRSTSFLDTTR